MTDPHIHEEHEVIVDRETTVPGESPMGAIIAVVAVILVLALVWWLVAAPRSTGPGSGTNPGGAPAGTSQPTEQAPAPTLPKPPSS
jgi:hypothetical protein